MKKLFVSLLVIVSITLIGCAQDNKIGMLLPIPGVNGTDGMAGPQGNDGVWQSTNKTLTLSAISVANSGGKALISFTVKDGTVGKTGIAATNARFILAELNPATAGGSGVWNNIAIERSSSTTYSFGTLTEVGGGKYTYLSSANFPAGATLKRLVIIVRSLTGYNVVNKSYDFMVSAPGTEVTTGNKDVVTSDACNVCHGANINSHGHGGGYTETKTCVTCHTPSNSYYTTMVADRWDFVSLAHQIHSAYKTTSTAVDPAPKLQTGKSDWSGVKYPTTMLNCVKCHAGAEATNWNTKPGRVACSSCHTTITWDGSSYYGIKSTSAVPKTGQAHGATDDSTCASCHTAADITGKHALTASNDDTKRPVTVAISGVTVDGAGGVTVNFSVSDTTTTPATPVTDLLTTPACTDSIATGTACLQTLGFTLVKLDTDGTNSQLKWISYTARAATAVATKAPVLESYNESAINSVVADRGTLTDLTGGAYSYKFKLLNASTPGDIRTVDHVHNTSSTTLSPATYTPASVATFKHTVAYDATKTHRVGMSYGRSVKAASSSTMRSTAVNAKWNATFDFVPDGTTAGKTRNIVSMTACQSCHGPKRIHAGDNIEYCVTCHNRTTFDRDEGPSPAVPLTAADFVPGDPDPANAYKMVTSSSSDWEIDVEKLAHKIHMSTGLKASPAWTFLGNAYNAEKIYPQQVKNCTSCHDESTTLADKTKWRTNPNTRSCLGCHDTTTAAAHTGINTNGTTETCVVCHGDGRTYSVQTAHQ